MIKILQIVILLLSIQLCFGQQKITFKIEDLESPDKCLIENSFSSIISKINPKIEKYCKTYDSLACWGNHSFLHTMYRAYSDHRPVVISPQMIWLLICQGFSNHINNNAEELRDELVDFKGKKLLSIQSDKIKLGDINSPWEDVFPEFEKQISEYTGTEFINILKSDFSNTTINENIATQITIMDAMEPFFEYLVIYTICGIPEFTLEGTTEDWEKVLQKTEYLRKYKLDWWINKLTPILKELIKTSKGKINRVFWKNFFKYHRKNYYGAPNIIDGWIVKFYPYDKNGTKMNLKSFTNYDIEDLPDEIVSVDFTFVNSDSNNSNLYPMQFYGGFIGAKQDKNNYALRPEIGWFIGHKDTSSIEKFLITQSASDIIIKNIDSIPNEIFKLKKIKDLTMIFKENINIDNRLANIEIEILKLYGQISDIEINRIKTLFPHSELTINGTKID